MYPKVRWLDRSGLQSSSFCSRPIESFTLLCSDFGNVLEHSLCGNWGNRIANVDRSQIIWVRKEPGQTTTAPALPQFIITQIMFKVFLPWWPWASEGVGDHEGHPRPAPCVHPQDTASPMWSPALGHSNPPAVWHWHRHVALYPALPAFPSSPESSTPLFLLLQRHPFIFCPFLKLACLFPHRLVGIPPLILSNHPSSIIGVADTFSQSVAQLFTVAPSCSGVSQSVWSVWILCEGNCGLDHKEMGPFLFSLSILLPLGLIFGRKLLQVWTRRKMSKTFAS